MSKSSNGAVIFVAGIAVGALVGAVAALLVAPQTGVDTRRALARQSKRLARRGREAWEEFGDEFKRQRSAVRRRIASAL
jgi:gas vesicle protein